MDNKTKLAKGLIFVGLLWCAVGLFLIVGSNLLVHLGGNEFQLLEPKHLRSGALTGMLVFPGLGLFLVGRFMLREKVDDAAS